VISRNSPQLFGGTPLLGFSLLAIAVVGDQPYLGLAIALAGGVILGFVCMMRFESVTAQPSSDGALERVMGRG